MGCWGRGLVEFWRHHPLLVLPLLVLVIIISTGNHGDHMPQPMVSLEAASLASFNYSGRSNDRLSYDLVLNVSFTTPHSNRSHEFCYETIEGKAFLGEIQPEQKLGYARLPGFCQPLRNRTFVSLAFSVGADSGSTGGRLKREGWFVGYVRIHVRGWFMNYSCKCKGYVQDSLLDGLARCRVEVPLPSHGKASAWPQRRSCQQQFFSDDPTIY